MRYFCFKAGASDAYHGERAARVGSITAVNSTITVNCGVRRTNAEPLAPRELRHGAASTNQQAPGMGTPDGAQTAAYSAAGRPAALAVPAWKQAPCPLSSAPVQPEEAILEEEGGGRFFRSHAATTSVTSSDIADPSRRFTATGRASSPEAPSTVNTGDSSRMLQRSPWARLDDSVLAIRTTMALPMPTFSTAR